MSAPATPRSPPAIDPEGRIVLTGSLSRPGVQGYDGFVARLLPDGTPDPDFNGGVAEIIDVQGSTNTLQSVAIDAVGRIVVAGDIGVVRLLPGGKPDPSFSGDGKATLDYGSGMTAADVTLDDQGRIVLAGSSDVAPPSDHFSEFAAARLWGTARRTRPSRAPASSPRAGFSQRAGRGWSGSGSPGCSKAGIWTPRRGGRASQRLGLWQS